MQISAKTLTGCAIFVSSATAMSIRQTGGAMNIVNAYGVAMQQSADNVLGWWASEQPAAVFIQWPTSGNPTALQFANGKCLHVDNVVPYQTDCTGNDDEWWYYENERMMWGATGFHVNAVGDLTVEQSGNSAKVHYVAAALPNAHEISCEQKFVGRSVSICDTFQTSKLCCDYSHKCGDLPKCTSSFCCRADSSAKYLVDLVAVAAQTSTPANSHEIFCEKKYEGRSDHPKCSNFQSTKICCDYSHNCGDLPKCTSSFCCKPDDAARYLTESVNILQSSPSPSSVPSPSASPSAANHCEADAAQLGADTWTRARNQVGDSCHDLDQAFSEAMLQAPQKECANVAFCDTVQHMYDAGMDICVSECVGYGKALGSQIGQQLCRVLDLFAEDESDDEGVTLFVCNEKEKKACHEAYANYIATSALDNGEMCINGVSSERTQEFHDQLETTCEITIGPDQ